MKNGRKLSVRILFVNLFLALFFTACSSAPKNCGPDSTVADCRSPANDHASEHGWLGRY